MYLIYSVLSIQYHICIETILLVFLIFFSLILKCLIFVKAKLKRHHAIRRRSHYFLSLLPSNYWKKTNKQKTPTSSQNQSSPYLWISPLSHRGVIIDCRFKAFYSLSGCSSNHRHDLTLLCQYQGSSACLRRKSD